MLERGRGDAGRFGDGGGSRRAGWVVRSADRTRDMADCFGNLQETVVQGCVFGDGFAVRGHGHQPAEGCVFPVAGTQDDGDDARLASLVALHRAHHFDVVAIVGGEEVRAHQ